MVFCCTVVGCAPPGSAPARPTRVLRWEQLPPLPDAHGFAAPFAGVSDGALVVAGGANFPDGRPWDGARKIWHDRIYVLETPAGKWTQAGLLPRPLGYGVSVSLSDGLLCVGGSDERTHRTEVFLLRRTGREWVSDPWAALPTPLANACGALLAGTVYVFGGLTAADQPPTAQLLTLDVSSANRREASTWKAEETFPGRARMLAVAGAAPGSFFIFGGVALVPASDGKLRREYLRDVWRFTPGRGWNQLADLPEALAAAPSPAAWHDGQFLIFGGDDGRLADQVATLKDRHPGFSRRVLSYDVARDRWSTAEEMPYEPGPDPAANPSAGLWPTVTATVVPWHGRWVIPSGEARPGVRTSRVLAAEIPPDASRGR